VQLHQNVYEQKGQGAEMGMVFRKGSLTSAIYKQPKYSIFSPTITFSIIQSG
jgi:hypothetical protein